MSYTSDKDMTDEEQLREKQKNAVKPFTMDTDAFDEFMKQAESLQPGQKKSV